MIEVVLVIGTRPQIIKSVPVVKRAAERQDVKLTLIHTGQHYDRLMSEEFFKEFDFPEAENLEVRSRSHAHQTGKIMMRLERVLKRRRPRMVLVPGDTNSALASALTATKLNIPVAHMEAGARSYDMTMPEEVNRRLIDHCSQFLFAVSLNCMRNLRAEGLTGIFTGDTMHEVFSAVKIPPVSPSIVLVTIHRPSNVDDKEKLRVIVDQLCMMGDEADVVLPLHPRTKKRLLQFGFFNKLSKKVRLHAPFSYEETIHGVAKSKAVITDSGGLQKEAFWLRKPTITVRDTTEWVETLGLNQLSKPNEIYDHFRLSQSSPKFHGARENPYVASELASKLILDAITKARD